MNDYNCRAKIFYICQDLPFAHYSVGDLEMLYLIFDLSGDSISLRDRQKKLKAHPVREVNILDFSLFITLCMRVFSLPSNGISKGF